MDKNKVTYGLSNVHVWPITATSAGGVPTYGSVIAIIGSTAITNDAEGDINKFFADNGVFWQKSQNNGYSGKLTIADVPDDFREQILKEIKDKNGAFFENADNSPAEFAMAFEFDGDVNKVRHVFYRCTCTRPSVSSATTEDKTTPNTVDLSITAVPRADTRDVKAKCTAADTAAYAAWYGTAPYVKVPVTP